MKLPTAYKGREQAFVKHQILKMYLEIVAWHILWGNKEFVYVDGFSGPWKAQKEDYSDTSFYIATNILKAVRGQLAANHNRYRRITCIFVEKNKAKFEQLDQYAKEVSEGDRFKALPLHGEFENLIPKIAQLINGRFSLVFLDPKGWSDYPMRKLHPLFATRGEIIINFMYDLFNRVATSPNIAQKAKDELFGGGGSSDEIQAKIDNGQLREDAIMSVYMNRLKKFGKFAHVTSTPILVPDKDRTKYSLIYATRHIVGLRKFREVENRTITIQRSARTLAKYDKRIMRDRMEDLLGSSSFEGTGDAKLDEAIVLCRRNARQKITEILQSVESATYDDLRAIIMEIPFMHEPVLKDMLMDLKRSSVIDIPTLRPRHKPKAGDTISLIKAN